MSYEDCIRISVSIFPPKAFSIRSAISPERLDFLLSKLDKVGRDTCNAAAAAVTDKPAGPIISVRMKSPGWGGFFMGIALTPSILMVIFQVHIANFAVVCVYPKRQAPVSGNAQTPSAFAVASQSMFQLVSRLFRDPGLRLLTTPAQRTTKVSNSEVSIFSA